MTTQPVARQPVAQPDKFTCGACLLTLLISPFALLVGLMAYAQDGVWRRIGFTITVIQGLVSTLVFTALPAAMLAYLFISPQQASLGYIFQGIIAGSFTLFGLVVFRFGRWPGTGEYPPAAHSFIKRFFSPLGVILGTGLVFCLLLAAQLVFPAYAEPLKIAFGALGVLWLLGNAIGGGRITTPSSPQRRLSGGTPGE